MWTPNARYPLTLPAADRPWREVFSPNDGATLGSFQQLAPADVEAVAQRALAGHAGLRSVSGSARAETLRAIADGITRTSELLAQMIAASGAKPLKDARVEVQRAALTFELCAREALALATPPSAIFAASSPAAVAKRFRFHREPIGPVLALSAFNHPLNLLAHQVGTALAAGNSVVLKPSPAAPHCAHWLFDHLAPLLPEHTLQLVHAEVPQIEALVARPEFQYVSFIGSARIGWQLRRLLAPGTRLALEHGGTAAAVLLPDADLAKAARALLRGAFYHAGQVCISTQKIYLHASIFEEFCQLFVSEARRLKTGDARDADTDVGPLIRLEEKVRLQDWIHEAQVLGAKLLLAPEERAGNFLTPTILAETPAQAKLMREEAFGPVVNLLRWSDERALLRELEASPYHFAASVFGLDHGELERWARALPAMSVVVNDHTAWRVDEMPFGGHRQAGLGMGGVKFSVEEQTRLTQVTWPA